MEEEKEDSVYEETLIKKQNNTLPSFGNKETMNINSMIITNIRQSRYFKTDLFELKTFHEVIDEIYYRVTHLEPWEKNSRKLAGQVGMCAGVRGVAAGGIVSTPFCLLFKLFTLKLTRKQLNVMLNHVDSPYIRGLGFMYIRYCQPPNDFLNWYGPYLEDEEEIDLKAGGGYVVTIGQMCKMMLTKMEWFGTMFPRISVTVQKEIQEKLKQLAEERVAALSVTTTSDLASSNTKSIDDKSHYKRSDKRSSSPSDDKRRNKHDRSYERKRDRPSRRSRSRSPKRKLSRERHSRKYSRSPRRRSHSPPRSKSYRSHSNEKVHRSHH